MPTFAPNPLPASFGNQGDDPAIDKSRSRSYFGFPSRAVGRRDHLHPGDKLTRKL